MQLSLIGMICHTKEFLLMGKHITVMVMLPEF